MRKHNNFLRLAKKRTETALKYIDLVGNLSNKNNYEYTSAEVSAIFDALDESIKEARARFRLKDPREFNFDK